MPASRLKPGRQGFELSLSSFPSQHLIISSLLFVMASTGRGPSLLQVVNCSHESMKSLINGTYAATDSTNHGGHVYRKDQGGSSVAIYFWDARDGSEMCGWWIGPQVGGDKVWAFSASGSPQLPPACGWRIPWRGCVDEGIRVIPRLEVVCSGAAPRLQGGQHWEQRLLAKSAFVAAGRRLVAATVALASSPLMHAAIAEILSLPRDTFKAESNNGYIWLERKWVDAGNHCYATLFDLCLLFTGQETAGTVLAFRALIDKYPSTERSSSTSMKGDALEFALARCRETGPAVPAPLQQQRLDLNRYFVQAKQHYVSCQQQYAAVMQYDGPPTVSQMPPPAKWATLIYHTGE